MRPFPIQRLLAALSAVFIFGFTHVAPAVIRDGGIDPANLGKGDWVYYLSALTSGMGGNVPSVTNIASFMAYEKSQGIRYIIVKAADGATLYPSDSSPQFTASLVNAAHTAGLLIFGYNRSGMGGVNVAKEVAAADYVFNQGADGFVWDAESEWEVSNVPDNLNLAWQICGQTRTNWPNKLLAHAPFDIISYHSSFPYKEFGYWSDVVMPQIYPFNRVNVARSPSGNINWADANWRSWQNGLTGMWTNSIKPLAPVNHVYGPNPPNSGVSHIPDTDVGQFVDYLNADPHCVTAGGYKGASFWRADLHGAAQWAFIKEATIGDFPGIVNNIVIDNPTATRVGSWTAVRIFNNGTYYGTTETNTSFGTNYFYKAQGMGAAYVEYTPNVIVPGNYDVYEWHPITGAGLTAATDVPYVINYNGGSATIYANQQINDGRWNKLGRFDFAAGTTTIRVMDNFSDAGSVAMSDGIKLIFVPPTSAPAAPSGLTATAVSSSQINLAWNDNATNEVNFIILRSQTNGGPYANIATLVANSTNFANTGLSPSTTYYYVVRATNSVGASVNSNQASATTTDPTPTPPAITAQPQNLIVAATSNATFSVTASGSQPMFYQWRFNGAPLSGATDSSYTRVNAQPSHQGSYSVIVTNLYGGTNSSNATLIVNVFPPTITQHPQTQIAIGGQTAVFNVAANGTPPLTYRWYQDGVLLSWTNASISETHVNANDAGDYWAVVSNAYGSATSSVATVTIHFLLTTSATGAGSISVDPLQASYAPNSVVTLTVNPSSTNSAFNSWSGDATGNANPLTVTLTTNKTIGASFSGAAVSDIILDNPDAGVTYSGSWQTGTSSADKYGGDYRFAVGAVPGTSNAVFRPTISTPGKYDVFVWYSIGGNRATNAPWTVVWNGGSLTNYINQTVEGGRWVLLASAKPFAAGTNGYARLSNDIGVANKVVMADAIKFSHVDPPFIASSSPSQSVNLEDDFTFLVSAIGSGPLNYQWRFNNTPIPGATDSSFTKTNAQPSDAGNYSVVITNTAGSATSSDAALTVNLPPAITAHPTNQTVKAGTNVTFSASAVGSQPLRYQWKFNDASIPAATSSAYTLSNVQTNNAGTYSVVVTNMAGLVISSNAALTVTVPLPPRFQSIALSFDGQMNFLFDGEPGANYWIDRTTNFIDWVPLTNFIHTNGTVQLIDPSATNTSRGFYRARQ